MTKTKLAKKTVAPVKTVKTVKAVKSASKNKVAAKAKKSVSPAVAMVANVVSFILVSKVKLCFRECSRIIKVAEDTGCLIEIASGTKSGDTSSILSLVNLEIGIDKSLVLTIKGENKEEAFHRVSKIINGTAEEEAA